MKRYGNKVCYLERGTHIYVRYFMTETYRQAKDAMNDYIRCPPRERDTNRKLDRPTWKIIPVTRSEVDNGIWRECPF